MLPFSALDYFSVIWFFAVWIGYQRFADRCAKRGRPSLMSAMGRYRVDWWREMLARELRIVDVTIIANLSNSATFFASTTLLILGGLLALLGTSERVIAVMAELPFAAGDEEVLWEYKILLLIVIFVYAFFKFTWSLRQHNFCSVLVGASPSHEDDPARRADFVARSARIATSAADNFNYGLRAYYFGLAALGWFMNDWIFIVGTALVAAVLYWREFHSGALRVRMRP